MMKKYTQFLNEEVGIRNLKNLVKGFTKAEIWLHKDMDGICTAIAVKEFFKTYYQIETVNCHVIQYGGLEYSVKSGEKGSLKILCDFAHGKPLFDVQFDHHDKQVGAEDTSAYFKPARSNAETISGEISYSDIFTPQDIELIRTVDSANFLTYDIKPEDVQNAIFKYKKAESSQKNRFMMGLVVNRLLLAYKNKRINITSLDGKRDHINRNILECLVLDSTPSLYSIFNNIRHYVNKAKVKDRSGVLATPEEITRNLATYIDKMKNYKFIEDPETGDVSEFDPTNKRHQHLSTGGAKIGKGVHYDEEYNIISQYGGGALFKPGSYDRYVPFKNFPDANFICIVWPMGLIQVSCNPFKEKKLKDINLGEIAKEVLAKHQPLLSKFYISLEAIKSEFETGQDWKQMQKAEGEGYEGVGFKFSDLEAFYTDCVFKKEGKSIVKVDIHKEEGLEDSMNTIHSDMDQNNLDLLKSLKIPAWELIIRNSGGHPSITNISGLNFLKYNRPMMKIAYNTEKYVEILKTIAKDFINVMKEKIDIANKGGEVEYDTKGVKLLGQDVNEGYVYQVVDKEGKNNTVSKDDFIKAGSSKGMKSKNMEIDHKNRKVIAKFESFKESIGINLNDDSDDDIGPFSHWNEDSGEPAPVEKPKSTKWFIEWGLSGGFGGANNCCIIDAKSETEASKEAWIQACDEYDSMAGLHGLRDRDQIMEEDGVDEEEAENIFNEEREDWLDYSAEPYDPKKHDNKLKGL